MNVKNLMGGVVAAWWVAACETDAVEENRGKAVVCLAPRVLWRELPLNFMTAVPGDEALTDEEVAGVIHNISFTAALRADRISCAETMMLALAVEKYGILVKTQYADGRMVLLGNHEEPLFGTLKNVTGQTPKDSNPLNLNVSGRCRFGPMEMEEG